MPQDYCKLKECFCFSISLFQCGCYRNPTHGSGKVIIISASTKTREKGWSQWSQPFVAWKPQKVRVQT